MTIAINLTHFIKSSSNDLFQDYFLKFALSNSEHQFIFIGTGKLEALVNNSKNILFVNSSPRTKTSLMWKFWLDFTLPGIAKKYNAACIINTGSVCSLRTKIPQYLFIPDLSFLKSPHYFSKNEVSFLKKQVPASIKKATTIVTTSRLFAKEIEQQYFIPSDKIKLLHLIAGDNFHPLNWEEKESIKELYAEGKEYFLFSGEIRPGNNLVNLLKAFSFFKKRQKSNMQLIIAANSVPVKSEFVENFKTYKYRKEVKLLTDLPGEELAKITAAAYAFLYPSSYDCFTPYTLQAMQCEVPVITTHTDSVNELYGDAFLYADPANFEDIADKMMLVFKDETKRAEIIKKGKSKIQEIKNDNQSNQWWQQMPEPIQ